MNLINLTPHTINIGSLAIVSSGVVRCKVSTEVISNITFAGVSIPITSTVMGEVEGLPEPQENNLYIVSRIVADMLRDTRNDLVYPDQLVRDDKGIIQGCQSLSTVAVDVSIFDTVII